MLESNEVWARFPQFNAEAFAYGVYDPSGAILDAEAAVRALIELARRRGVEVNEGQQVFRVKESGYRVVIIAGSASEFTCEQVMIASGPWTRSLLPFLSGNLTTTRQEIAYFKPSATANADRPTFEKIDFPIFLELESGFYGFPIHYQAAMKIANHNKGRVVDPYLRDDRVDEEFIQRCRAFFDEFIPGLARARVGETRVCIYNNTPDDDFIIDWHPELGRVLIVTGFSGHGFKFGPTVGRIAAELLLSRRTSFDIDRFRLDRFNLNLGVNT
jgi:sarcosine oxidase